MKRNSLSITFNPYQLLNSKRYQSYFDIFKKAMDDLVELEVIPSLSEKVKIEYKLTPQTSKHPCVGTPVEEFIRERYGIKKETEISVSYHTADIIIEHRDDLGYNTIFYAICNFLNSKIMGQNLFVMVINNSSASVLKTIEEDDYSDVDYGTFETKPQTSRVSKSNEIEIETLNEEESDTEKKEKKQKVIAKKPTPQKREDYEFYKQFCGMYLDIYLDLNIAKRKFYTDTVNTQLPLLNELRNKTNKIAILTKSTHIGGFLASLPKNIDIVAMCGYQTLFSTGMAELKNIKYKKEVIEYPKNARLYEFQCSSLYEDPSWNSVQKRDFVSIADDNGNVLYNILRINRNTDVVTINLRSPELWTHSSNILSKILIDKFNMQSDRTVTIKFLRKKAEQYVKDLMGNYNNLLNNIRIKENELTNLFNQLNAIKVPEVQWNEETLGELFSEDALKRASEISGANVFIMGDILELYFENVRSTLGGEDFKVGDFTVIIPLLGTLEEIIIKNREPKQWEGGLIHHCHVRSHACWGSYSVPLMKAFSTLDIPQLCLIIRNFLENYNATDGWGKSIQVWCPTGWKKFLKTREAKTLEIG